MRFRQCRVTEGEVPRDAVRLGCKVSAFGMPTCVLSRSSGDVPEAICMAWEGIGYWGHWPHTGCPLLFKSSQLISLLWSDPIYFAECTFYHWMNSEVIKNIWVFNFMTTAAISMSSTVIFISDWNLVSFNFREWHFSFLLTSLFYLEDPFKLY